MIPPDPVQDPSAAEIEQPTPAPAPSDLPDVAGHACYLFYPVHLEAEAFAHNPKRTLADLLTPGTAPQKKNEGPATWIPADARATISGERLRQPIWEAAPLDVGGDLHPHICRLLGVEGADGEAGARTFRLSERARRLLNGERLSYARETPADERRPKRLGLDLRAIAMRRIERRLGGDPDCLLHLDLTDLRFVVFRTGQGVLMAEVVLKRSDAKPLHPCWIVEGVYALARIHTLRWWADDNTALNDPAKFTLGDIMHSLTGCTELRQQARRVFTATYVQFDEPLEPNAARRLAVQLSRRYTDDYRLMGELPGIEFVQDFESVLHAFTLEGCATLVDASAAAGGESSDFLKTYETITYQKHYLPVVLLAFHEFTLLLYLSNDASFWPELARAERDPLKRLERLRDQFLKFRLCYRFSHVSYISMHNATNRALRKALDLDKMAEELARDTAEIDAYLQEAAARRTEERFRWVNIFGGTGLAWLTSFTIAKELLEVQQVSKVMQVSKDAAGLYALMIGLIVGGIAGWVLWFKGRPRRSKGEKHEEKLGEHAAHEQVIHRALERGAASTEAGSKG